MNVSNIEQQNVDFWATICSCTQYVLKIICAKYNSLYKYGKEWTLSLTFYWRMTVGSAQKWKQCLIECFWYNFSLQKYVHAIQMKALKNLNQFPGTHECFKLPKFS